MDKPKRLTAEVVDEVVTGYWAELAGRAPSICDLALDLGYADDTELQQACSAAAPRLRGALRRAVCRIRSYHESRVADGSRNSQGSVYWLKSHGWTDAPPAIQAETLQLVKCKVVGRDGKEIRV